jgi:hypothetical protein
MKIGTLTNNNRLKDPKYVKTYLNENIIQTLRDNVVIQSSHVQIPMSQFKYIPVREYEMFKNVIDDILKMYYTKRIVPFLQNTSNKDMILHDSIFFKKKRVSFQKLNEQYQIFVNEMMLFLECYELFFFSPPHALEKMDTCLSNISPEFTKLIAKYRSVWFKRNEIPSRKLDVLVSRIGRRLDYGPRGFFTTIIVPDGVTDDILNWYGQQYYLGKRNHNFFFLKKSDTTEDLRGILKGSWNKKYNKVYMYPKNNIDHSVIMMEESTFHNVVPYGCMWFQNNMEKLFVFSMSYMYNPIAQHQVHSLFDKESNVDVSIFHGTTSCENCMLTRIYQRKITMLQQMNHDPERWLTDITEPALEHPRSFYHIRLMDVPLFEKQVYSYSRYPIQELSPLELVKCLSYGGIIETNTSPIEFFQRLTTDGTIIFPISNELEDKERGENDLFLRDGFIVSDTDIIELSKLLFILTKIGNPSRRDFIELSIHLMIEVLNMLPYERKLFIIPEIETLYWQCKDKALDKIGIDKKLSSQIVNIYESFIKVPERGKRKRTLNIKESKTQFQLLLNEYVKNATILMYFARGLNVNHDTMILKKNEDTLSAILNALQQWLSLYKYHKDIHSAVITVEGIILELESNVERITGQKENAILWF